MINLKDLLKDRKEWSNEKMTHAEYYSPSTKQTYEWDLKDRYWDLRDRTKLPSDLVLVKYQEDIYYYTARCYSDHKYYCYLNSKYTDLIEIGEGCFGSYRKEYELTDLAKELGMDHAYEIRSEWDSSD